jgi:hypothetical protein
LVPVELPLVLFTYVLVTFVSNLQVRSWWMLVFPLYALAQSLVMPLLGVYSYVVLARREGRPGRYRFGYRRGTPAGMLEQIADERLALAAVASVPAA